MEDDAIIKWIASVSDKLSIKCQKRYLSLFSETNSTTSEGN